ncbi:hypothetical protein [Ramlibacter sp. PS4R-6]|uniref:hypothetical protein n=1 Tax=Ramlibacter sp. PS4R-6 TaxID=3133438 RepID=UPI0030A05113
MAKILLQIAGALVAAVLVAWGLTRAMHIGVAIVFAAPVFAALAARPIIDFIAEMNYQGKAAALADVQGRYWSHRGTRIDIAEDDDDARWLLTSHVRKVVPGLPRDEVLLKQFGERSGAVEGFDGFRIRADALAEFLQKSTDTPSLKFRTWLDRTVLGGSVNPRSGGSRA